MTLTSKPFSVSKPVHTRRGINQLLATRDGKRLISAGEKTIRVWDVETRKLLRVLLGQIGTGANGSIQRMALSRDDKHLVALARWNPGDSHAAQDWETDVRVYELATGNLQSRFRYHGVLQDLDLSPDGKYLAMVGYPGGPGSSQPSGALRLEHLLAGIWRNAHSAGCRCSQPGR